MKWLKLLLLIPLLLVLAAAYCYQQFTSDPEDHKIFQWSFARRVELANEVKLPLGNLRDKIADAQNAILNARVEHRPPAATLPGQEPFTFTDEQINALIQDLREEKADWWKEKIGKYVVDPVVLLQDGQFVLRGRMPELRTMLSLYIQPSIDKDGLLHMDIVKRMGGKLTLPGAIVDGQLARLKTPVLARLPAWRKEAKLDEDGAFNAAAADAATGQMLVDLIDGKGVRPVFYVTADHGRYVPVRLTDVRVEKEKISFAVLPIDRDQRPALLEQITSPPAVAESK